LSAVYVKAHGFIQWRPFRLEQVQHKDGDREAAVP
jgi:hypothetical protein